MPESSRTTSRTKLALEGLVILASILLALFLEGWRDDRELAREVSLELVSVGLELERNRDVILAELDAIDRIVTSTDDVLVVLGEAPDDDLVQVADSLAWLATVWVPTLDPSLGAVDALISSGRLSQVGNPELRLGLAGLRDLFLDAMEESRTALRLVEAQLWPRLVTSPDMAAIRRVSREFVSSRQDAGASPQEQLIGGGMPTYQDVTFPNGADVRGTLNLKLIWLEGSIAELRPMIPHLERLIALVAAETLVQP